MTQTPFINTCDNLKHNDNKLMPVINVSQRCLSPCLSLAVHFQSVAAFPASTSWATNCLAVAVTLAEATWLAWSWSEATHLTMLHHWLAQPLSIWVVTDCCMERIHTDHLEVLVRRVLSNPVAVHHSQCFALTANTFLSTQVTVIQYRTWFSINFVQDNMDRISAQNVGHSTCMDMHQHRGDDHPTRKNLQNPMDCLSHTTFTIALDS